LKTIKIPKNILLLTNRLPKPTYTDFNKINRKTRLHSEENTLNSNSSSCKDALDQLITIKSNSQQKLIGNPPIKTAVDQLKNGIHMENVNPEVQIRKNKNNNKD